MYLIGLSLSAAVHCESAVRQSASTCNACCKADRTGLSRCTWLITPTHTLSFRMAGRHLIDTLPLSTERR